MVARRWGVVTRDIVLYPFGGVARMERIPPGRAELAIALAGPAVTAALAGLLYLATFLLDAERPDAPGELAAAPLVWQLVWANVFLLGFNLIPAFPMDGGRALRAGLSLILDERQATRIATTAGQILAVLLAVVAIFCWEGLNPFLLLIAFFVFVGASQEAAYRAQPRGGPGIARRATPWSPASRRSRRRTPWRARRSCCSPPAGRFPGGRRLGEGRRRAAPLRAPRRPRGRGGRETRRARGDGARPRRRPPRPAARRGAAPAPGAPAPRRCWWSATRGSTG